MKHKFQEYLENLTGFYIKYVCILPGYVKCLGEGGVLKRSVSVVVSEPCHVVYYDDVSIVRHLWGFHSSLRPEKSLFTRNLS